MVILYDDGVMSVPKVMEYEVLKGISYVPMVAKTKAM